MNKILRSMMVVAGVAAAGVSHAAIDVSAVTTAIGDAATPIASIGAAVLVVLVGVQVYKWIRRAL